MIQMPLRFAFIPAHQFNKSCVFDDRKKIALDRKTMTFYRNNGGTQTFIKVLELRMTIIRG